MRRSACSRSSWFRTPGSLSGPRCSTGCPCSGRTSGAAAGGRSSARWCCSWRWAPSPSSTPPPTSSGSRSSRWWSPARARPRTSPWTRTGASCCRTQSSASGTASSSTPTGSRRSCRARSRSSSRATCRGRRCTWWSPPSCCRCSWSPCGCRSRRSPSRRAPSDARSPSPSWSSFVAKAWVKRCSCSRSCCFTSWATRWRPR